MLGIYKTHTGFWIITDSQSGSKITGGKGLYNRIKQLSNGIQRIWIGVFLLMAIVALAACGSDAPVKTRCHF